MKILLNMKRWRENLTNLYFLPQYRNYYPLLSLSGDIAIMPLRVLILESYDWIFTQEVDQNLNIVSELSRFKEIKEYVCSVDYLLNDKLNVELDELSFGALYGQGDLHAAIFVSCGNIYIYPSTQVSLNKCELQSLLAVVLKKWLQSNELTSFVCLVRSNDVLEMTLKEVGFQYFENNEGMLDKLVLIPSSEVSCNPLSDQLTCPDEIFLLMGQSNMSGRGPLFGSSGLTQSPALPLFDLDRLIQITQDELLCSGQPRYLRINPTNSEKVDVQYTAKYVDRIQKFDIHFGQWRLHFPIYIFM